MKIHWVLSNFIDKWAFWPNDFNHETQIKQRKKRPRTLNINNSESWPFISILTQNQRSIVRQLIDPCQKTQNKSFFFAGLITWRHNLTKTSFVSLSITPFFYSLRFSETLSSILNLNKKDYILSFRSRKKRKRWPVVVDRRNQLHPNRGRGLKLNPNPKQPPTTTSTPCFALKMAAPLLNGKSFFSVCYPIYYGNVQSIYIVDAKPN